MAIKEVWLPPAISATEQAERLRRAAREARNAARLRDHPHIVAVHHVVIDDAVPWIVMQLVDGHSLEEHLTAHGPLPVDQAANLATALLRAPGAAHEAGITHRDVKPANVMLTTHGEVLLTDFGIAVHQADTALTATGAFIGSVEYMAPERLRDTDGLAASDLFSLGATLYQTVEGTSSFRRDTPIATLTAVLSEPAPPPQRVGQPLGSLIMQLLDKNPDQRPTIPQALARTDPPPTPSTRRPTRANAQDPAHTDTSEARFDAVPEGAGPVSVTRKAPLPVTTLRV